MYIGAGGVSKEKHNGQAFYNLFSTNQCIAAKDSIVTIEMLVCGSCTVLYYKWVTDHSSASLLYTIIPIFVIVL